MTGSWSEASDNVQHCAATMQCPCGCCLEDYSVITCVLPAALYSNVHLPRQALAVIMCCRLPPFQLGVCRARHWPEDGKLRSRSGTPVYMAPEVVLQVHTCRGLGCRVLPA